MIPGLQKTYKLGGKTKRECEMLNNARHYLLRVLVSGTDRQELIGQRKRSVKPRWSKRLHGGGWHLIGLQREKGLR